jgi:hypothetical protein
VWHVNWKKKDRQKNLRWTITADSDWQETDPTSRQRGRPTENSGRKCHSGLGTKTYWLTVSRNVTSASAYGCRVWRFMCFMDTAQKEGCWGHDQYFYRGQAVEPLLLIDWFPLQNSAGSEVMKHEYQVFTPAASILSQLLPPDSADNASHPCQAAISLWRGHGDRAAASNLLRLFGRKCL